MQVLAKKWMHRGFLERNTAPDGEGAGRSCVVIRGACHSYTVKR